MLKRIVHPSQLLVTFVTLLHLNISKPQRKRLLRTADAIIVCEGRKTLANQHRVEHARETLISACQQAIQWGSILDIKHQIPFG